MKFFIFKEKNALDNFSPQELREMQIQLDRKSGNLKKEIETIEGDIASLFEKARSAKTKSEEITLAHRIKTLQERQGMKLKAQAELEKELRAISNISILKEHEEDLKVAGVWGKLKKMDPEKLDRDLRGKVLDAQDHNTLVNDVIKLTGESMAAGTEFDEDIGDILKTVHSVKKGELDPEVATKKVSKEMDLS
jgi:hypothetical protein